jgi:hypothetical protein
MCRVRLSLSLVYGNPPGVGINSRPHRMEKQCKRLGTKRKEPDENLSFETQKLTVEKDT